MMHVSGCLFTHLLLVQKSFVVFQVNIIFCYFFVRFSYTYYINLSIYLNNNTKQKKIQNNFCMRCLISHHHQFFSLIGRKDILNGILGSNLVSFQSYNYARHFSSNCTRILGYEYTPAGIDANGSIVGLGVHPIGIDVQRVRHHCHRPGVRPKMKAIRAKYGPDMKIIVGRDKLDPVKGVLQKLESFEQFLKNYPEWVGRAMLIQVTSPGVVDCPPKLETKAAEAVNRINSRYGSLSFQPVHHYHQHIDRDEYYALLSVADVLLVTPLADGMNTTSLEFVVAQEETNKSPMVLSEFTGTAGSLSAAEIVNPYDYAQIADALHDCLVMSNEEKEERFKVK